MLKNQKPLEDSEDDAVAYNVCWVFRVQEDKNNKQNQIIPWICRPRRICVNDFVQADAQTFETEAKSSEGKNIFEHAREFDWEHNGGVNWEGKQ